MIKGDYYLGLDIGTNSVGWAVTDENYNLVRAKGKDLWGVRLFEEASTAEDRRSHRTSRRRTDRKKARLQLLREIFEEEVEKIDKGFFNRMDESKYWLQDKKTEGKYALFNDGDFTDKDYFNDYPTIFHLRKALMEGNTSGDIRLYFLAINQMMKRRGHFLFEGQKFSNVPDVEGVLDDLHRVLTESPFDLDIDEDFIQEFRDIIEEFDLKKTEKNNMFKKLINDLNLEKVQIKQLTAITRLVVSGKAPLSDIFNNPSLKEEEVKDVEFDGDKFEEKGDEIEEILGGDFELIQILKRVYDYSKLKEVLSDYTSISQAQVAKYQKHAGDLVKLKKLIRKYDDMNKTSYKEVFVKTDQKCNYVNYVGSTNKNGRKISVKKCTSEDFLKYLGKKLKSICDSEDPSYLHIANDIEKGIFLPKQIVSTNGVIPYQVHHYELQAILGNMVLDYPEFLKEDEDGIKLVDKIDKLFRFRIPYYVGPLNPAHKGEVGANSWIIKREGYEDVQVRPWNFDKVVDAQACEEEFIKRLTNQCTYLPDQKVLPKESILYSEYMVFNELNNLKINGVKPSGALKEKIFEELFCRYKTVKQKKLRSWLIANNYADKDVVLGGFDDDFKSSMKSLIEMRSILGDDFDREMAETIIEWITIHAGNSEVINGKIKKVFPSLDDDKCKKLSLLKYKDWGRFSRKFLMSFEGADIETGEIGTIIYFLREKDDNLMQLLSKRYTFEEELFRYKSKFLKDGVSYDMLDDLYVSPAVRKMIWQVISITEELRKVLGSDPKRIFIEMARGKEDRPERKESRKNQLIELYKSIKKESRDWVGEIDSKDHADFRNERLFLYYTQMGKCMYSGETIDLAQLDDKNLYDVDHVIPRSLKKDDSALNNKVLVKRDLNQHVKKNYYPVPEQFRRSQSGLWKMLLDKKFITKTKYERLIRNIPLSDEELAEFIERQLVETRQTTKVVADIFKQAYKESRIVYVKSRLVSEFRQDFDLLKLRDINDLHHAHDAYLNIVVGNGYYTKFTGNALQFVKKNRGNYSLNKLFKGEIKGPGGKTVWDVATGLKIVRENLDKPSVLFTREAYEGKGELFNATIVGKDEINDGTDYLPLKKDDRLEDITKYGAYKSISGAYFFIVEHQVRKDRIITIEYVPVYLKESIKNNRNALTEYCKEDLGLKDPKILVDKVLMKNLVQINGFRYTLNGRTGKQIKLQPAHQPFWRQQEVGKLKMVLGALDKSEKFGRDLCEDIEEEVIVHLFNRIQDKLSKPPYSNRINIPGIILDYNIESSDLIKKEKCTLVKEMLNLVKPTLNLVDLSKVNGPSKAGVTFISKKINKLEEVKLIHQSITGIYEKEVKII